MDRDADLIHLAWPSNVELSIRWRTSDQAAGSSTLRLRQQQTIAAAATSNYYNSNWISATGKKLIFAQGTPRGIHHEVLLSLPSQLLFNTAYEYQIELQPSISGSSVGWSPSYFLTTIPSTTDKITPVSAAFMADVGLQNAQHGLVTGASRLASKLQELSPTVVLGGGDFLYFDDDPVLSLVFLLLSSIASALFSSSVTLFLTHTLFHTIAIWHAG